MNDLLKFKVHKLTLDEEIYILIQSGSEILIHKDKDFKTIHVCNTVHFDGLDKEFTHIETFAEVVGSGLYGEKIQIKKEDILGLKTNRGKYLIDGFGYVKFHIFLPYRKLINGGCND